MNVKFTQLHVFILQLFVSLIFISALFHHNIDSKFGITNDHDIVHALGSDLSMSIKEIPGLVMKSEGRYPGTSLRYRPLYFPIFYTELALWGGDPRPWYVLRIVLFSITLAIAWHLLGKKLGVLGGGFASVVMLSHSFWIEVYSTIINAESYAAPALCVYCLAYSKLWGNEQQKAGRWWLLLAVGAVIAMGCKENFTLLLIPTVFLIYRAYASRSLKIAGILSSSFIMLSGLFIVGAVLIALRNKGVDVYSNDVSSVSRLSLISQFFSKFKLSLLPIVVTLLLVIVERCSVYYKIREKLSIDLKMLGYQSICLLGLLSQYLFYNGQWPVTNRYDFPGLIFSDISWIMLVYCLVKFTSIQLLDLTGARENGFRIACYTGIFLIFFFAKGRNEIKGLYAGSTAYSIATNRFQDVLKRTIEIAKQEEKVPVIIATNTILDYEGIHSLAKYMTTLGVKNKLGIRIDGSEYASPSTPFMKQLAREIMTLSEDGGIICHGIYIHPLMAVTQNCPCTILNINLYDISFNNL